MGLALAAASPCGQDKAAVVDPQGRIGADAISPCLKGKATLCNIDVGREGVYAVVGVHTVLLGLQSESAVPYSDATLGTYAMTLGLDVIAPSQED